MIILAIISILFIVLFPIVLGVRLVILSRGIGKNVEQVIVGSLPSFLPGDKNPHDYKKRIVNGQIEWYRPYIRQ